MNNETDPRKRAAEAARIDCHRANCKLRAARALLEMANRTAAAAYSENNEAARLAAAARVAVAAAALERCRVRFTACRTA